MKRPNNLGEAAGFTVHQNLSGFSASFGAKLTGQKFQCLNCEAWKRGDKFVAVGQFAQMTKEVFGFRFCRACWQSYRSVSPELKQDFIKNIRAKITNALEVKSDV